MNLSTAPIRKPYKLLLSKWAIAWLVVWIANLAAYGLRQHSGLPLYLEVSSNYLEGVQMYLHPKTERIFSLFMYGLSQRAGLPPYLDVPSYLLEGTQAYSETQAGVQYDRFAYPPFMATPTVWLVHLPGWAQRVLWCGFNSGLLILSIAMITRVARPVIESIARQRTTSIDVLFAIYWTVIGLVTIRYVLSPFENQSHDVIILVLLAIATLASIRRREIWVGIALGLATALKLTPLLFLVLLAVQGRFKAAITMVAVTIVCTIAPDMLVPNNTRHAHVVHFYHIIKHASQPGKSGGEGQWKSWNPLNQNLSGTIYRVTARPPEWDGHDEWVRSWFPLIQLTDENRRTVTLLLQGMVFLSVLAVAWRTRGPPTSRESSGILILAQMGIVVCAMLLLSPQSSKSHFITLMIPAAAIILHYLKSGRDWIDLVILICAGILGSLTARDVIGDLNSEVLLGFGSVTLSALLLGIGCLRIGWSAGRSSGHEVHARSEPT